MRSLKSYFYQAASAVHLIDLNVELRLAAIAGRTEAVKALLEAGADVHTKNDAPLLFAALNGHTETVKELLAAGADLHARSDSALFSAVLFNKIDTARALLEAGADVNAVAWLGKSSQGEFGELLREWMADTSANDKPPPHPTAP